MGPRKTKGAEQGCPGAIVGYIRPAEGSIMLNRLVGNASRAAIALGVCAAMMVASGSAQAAPTSTTCANQTLSNTVISGNLAVPAGTGCELDNAYVKGNVSAGSNTELLMGGDQVGGSVSVGSGAFFVAQENWIQRNLSTEGTFTVNMIENEVDGNSSFDATSGDFSVCDYGISNCQFDNYNPGVVNPKPHGPLNKFGNVSITNTSPAAAVYADNFVSGSLTCYGNADMLGYGSNLVLGKESGQCVGF